MGALSAVNLRFDFAKAMLGVADNLSRALQSAPEEVDEATKNLLMGVEMTQKELLDGMARFGVKKVEALGAPFDPNLHQAMYEVDDPSQPAGLVAQVMQDGFTMHDRLLRPAMVGVTKGGPKLSEAGESDPGANVDQSA